MRDFSSLIRSPRLPRVMNLLLAAIAIVQIGLFMLARGSEPIVQVSQFMREMLYIGTLVVLISVVCVRHIYDSIQRRDSETAKLRMEALVGIFKGVKHRLNNDMQVVLGNAELAQIQFSNGAELSPTLDKINAAAHYAVERIEQLSVFANVTRLCLEPVDLNAMLQACIDKQIGQLPDNVTLRLEPAVLTKPVVVDRYLLRLSLEHLMHQSISTLDSGGEIVFKTSSRFCLDESREIQVLTQMIVSYDEDDFGGMNSRLNAGLVTSKALLERSGAVDVTLAEQQGSPAGFSIRFCLESAKNAKKPATIRAHLLT